MTVATDVVSVEHLLNCGDPRVHGGFDRYVDDRPPPPTDVLPDWIVEAYRRGDVRFKGSVDVATSSGVKHAYFRDTIVRLDDGSLDVVPKGVTAA